MVWAGVGVFLFGSGSRRQFELACDQDTDILLENFRHLSGIWLEGLPTNKAVADLLEKMRPEELAQVAPAMVNRLLRGRKLEHYRLLGAYYRIAIDGTGIFSSRERHCPFCLTQTHDNGTTIYYHLALEAKLITPTGLAFSIATEFIENTDPNATKQDCELKAFSRLTRKIKDRFGRLPICLLLDGIYANQGVFDLCAKNDWQWIITFKEGSLPCAFSEFQTLKKMTPQNTLQAEYNDTEQRLAWVPHLEHAGHRFQAFECHTTNEADEPQYFAWITSLPVSARNISELVNQGGRQRWKIENQGFNVQKNGDCQLEHIYSHHPIAAKNYYLLLQIAHIITQLMIHGRLRKSFRERIQSLKNYFRVLVEHMRNRIAREESVNATAIASMQIRLDTS
jgi:hypothetical protein